MLRYSLYALFLGLTASACAEALLNKDVGQLSLDEIEENLQVRATTTAFTYMPPFRLID